LLSNIYKYNLSSFVRALSSILIRPMFIFVAIKWYRSDNESCKGTNTEDLDVDFELLVNQAEDEEDEDCGLPPELKRMVEQEDREVKPHQEEMDIVNLGVGEERKEAKVGTSMTTPI